MSDSPETPPDPTISWRQRGLRIVRRILIYYLGIVLVLSYFQRRLLYVPTAAPELPVALYGGLGAGEDVVFRTDDGLDLHGWHLLPAGRRLSSRAEFDRDLIHSQDWVILFFPGNGGNRRHRDLDFKLLTRLPAHVFAFDYRGYGENPGSPSEAKLAEDAQAAWKYVTGTRQVPANRVLIYGESLGGGVATRLASELCLQKTPPAGLILCSTFSSMVDTASHHYPWLPVRTILKDRYPSVTRIRDVTVPLLMLHGKLDRIVPYPLGRQLFAAAPDKSLSGLAKTFVDLPRADHNDILFTDEKRYVDGLTAFVNSLRE